MSMYKFFTASTTTSNEKLPWALISLPLTLSLAFALFYGILGLQIAFKTDYVAQDDAREYVFWMQRFVDPELFHHDLMANYFQSITPLGYATLYKIIANLGIPPLLLSKILPIFLGLITTIYCFYLSLKIFPVPTVVPGLSAKTQTLATSINSYFSNFSVAVS